MRQVPDCLQRRYKAMDELVSDLTSEISNQAEPGYPGNKDDRGIKLMCKFWNILKEDPNCDLQHAVQERMALNTLASSHFGPQDITCYQVEDNSKPPIKCGKDTCAKTQDPDSKATGASCCNREQVLKAPDSAKSSVHSCCNHEGRQNPTPMVPLNQALGTMKEAASSEQKCYEKTAELMKVQEKLKEQITQLEEREETEVELLKEAEKMWTTMENEYKQKLEASKKRQEELLKQQKEVEASANKWRKNKKNLEEQVKNVDKCLQEISEKYKKKTNDLKAIELEMADMNYKIDCNTKEVANASIINDAKRKAFEKNMEALTAESNKLQEAKTKEEKIRDTKISSGNECVKEGREELAKVCRILLKNKLENEDLRAEAKALVDEIDLLKTTCNQCAERCKNKEESLKAEIDKCQAQIDKYKLRCTKCHVSCDTKLLRKYCTDCPRCQEEMEPCVYGGDTCTELATNECVCMDIKQKFMNNVFDNMYTVLARQINTRPGKAVSEQVLKCLKCSTNGKLDPGTRKKLQDFILAAVKTNLNLTIIGGAVKTRCEMDPDTYKDLMRCLTQVKVIKPEKLDKGTDSRKAPCARWGGPNECNCPYGPKSCVCTTRAPRPPKDSEPCGQLDEDKQDIGELSICPHKDKTPCGPLCGNEPKPDSAAIKLASAWKPPPCGEKACKFNSSIKNARCTMTNFNEGRKVARASSTRAHSTNVPLFVVPSDFDSMSLSACDCGGGSNCVCYGSSNNKKKHAKDEFTFLSEAEIKEMFNHKHTTLPVTVLAQNGTIADFNARLKMTSSGQLALDVRRISDVGEIAYTTEEYPVSLIRTSSSYKLIVSEFNLKPNAVLKKGSSGEMDVIMKDVHEQKNKKRITSNYQENVYRVKLKNTNQKEANNFALIKRTPSGNYEFVLDKEFENLSKEIISNTLCDSTECSVNLSKTKTGMFIIDFKEGCNVGKCYHNAILSKSASGNVKLIVQDLDYNELKRYNPTLRKGRTEFENLYKQLCTNTPIIQNKPHREHNILERKLDNGLLLNENIRLKIQDEKHFVAEVLVRLNKISPGQYYAVFNNDAEASFVCNLVTSWLGILPVQRITERYLIVDLNWDKELKHRFGWLKITSNGKILIAVDSKVTRGVQNDVYSVGRFNKDSGITTTCHQKMDCCDCDKSKCCCDGFSQEWFDRKF